MKPRSEDGTTPGEPSAAAFVKWSALSLAVIVVLGVIAARVLHSLGIE